jgi:hypothetical protein
VSAAAGLLSCLSCDRNDAELRIYNDGSVVLQQFTVLFPKDEVTFGEVGANARSSYLRVPHGIGRDASFRFVLNGVPVKQFVADFVGWKPLSGKAFTYHVRIEPGRSQPFLHVIEVVRDK